MGRLGAERTVQNPRRRSRCKNYESLRLSSDGATVAFAYQEYGVPVRFSLTKRQLTHMEEATLLSGITAASGVRAPRIKGLKVTDWKNTTAPKLAGQQLALHRGEYSQSLAIAHDASFFLLGTEWNLRSYTAKGRNAGG